MDKPTARIRPQAPPSQSVSCTHKYQVLDNKTIYADDYQIKGWVTFYCERCLDIKTKDYSGQS